MENILITIEADLYPTEDPERVCGSIQSIFPDAQIKILNGNIKAISRSLDHFLELLEKQRIRDSARDILRYSLVNDVSTIYLNKQVATLEKISFSQKGESNLGEIKVEIQLDGWEELFGLLTPPVLE